MNAFKQAEQAELKTMKDVRTRNQNLEKKVWPRDGREGGRGVKHKEIYGEL